MKRLLRWVPLLVVLFGTAMVLAHIGPSWLWMGVSAVALVYSAVLVGVMAERRGGGDERYRRG